MNDPRFLVLCNNSMAIPAIRELFFHQYLAGIVIPADSTGLEQDILDLPEIKKELIIPVIKNNFSVIIEKLITDKQVTACFIMTFPFIIPEKSLKLPPKGFLNFHYGALPMYRGPHPILAQMLAGEDTATVTVHVADKGIDTGPVVMREQVTIATNDTFGRLQTKLSVKGASMLSDLIKVLSFGSVVPAVKQDESKAVYHAKPTAAQLFINWKKMDAKQIIRTINACNPWNKGAGALIEGRVIGITEAELVHGNDVSAAMPSGTIVSADAENGLMVQCKDDGCIRITIIYTPEGFMSGHRIGEYGIKKGDKFQ